MARSCEQDGVPLRSMKGVEYLEQLSSVRSHLLGPELL
jgi:hypothetical protein